MRRRRLAVALVALPVAASLTFIACASGDSTTTSTTHPDRVSLGWGGNLRLETFPDGTRCVVYDAGDHGGLDCDFPDR